jgi:hypothetical protein
MRKLVTNIGLILAVLFVAISCSRAPKPQVSFDISVRNDTATNFDVVVIHWETVDASWSDPSLSPSSSKQILGGCEPPSADTAELRITEHKDQQPHSIKLNVSALRALSAGKHEVVFSVTALDKAQIFVDGQPR